MAMSKFTQKLEEFNVIAFDTRREVIGPEHYHSKKLTSRTFQKVDQHVSRKFDKQSIMDQVTVYAEKESGEVLDHVDNVHWVYGRKISEQKIAKNMER